MWLRALIAPSSAESPSLILLISLATTINTISPDMEERFNNVYRVSSIALPTILEMGKRIWDGHFVRVGLERDH